MAPGETKEMVWRLTRCGGTYTVNYEVGRAPGQRRGGERRRQPEGKFVVTISTKPPTATVDDQGNVVTED